MNEQINLRMPSILAKAARKKAKSQGYGSIQEYIEEAVREKTFEVEIEPVTKKQARLIQQLIDLNNKRNSWVSEKELFTHMSKSIRKSQK